MSVKLYKEIILSLSYMGHKRGLVLRRKNIVWRFFRKRTGSKRYKVFKYVSN